MHCRKASSCSSSKQAISPQDQTLSKITSSIAQRCVDLVAGLQHYLLDLISDLLMLPHAVQSCARQEYKHSLGQTQHTLHLLILAYIWVEGGDKTGASSCENRFSLHLIRYKRI